MDNRQDTIDAVLSHQADFGIAWDGDFDRCFLFDEQGRFIEGYYIVGLLAEAFLEKYPGSRIIHDPRLIWNTLDIVKQHGGQAIQSKTGHAFIKERMRQEDAVYGGLAGTQLSDAVAARAGAVRIHVLAEDLAARGLDAGRLLDGVKPLGYDGFVDLVAKTDRTQSWL